jgi:hypothetical protein
MWTSTPSPDLHFNLVFFVRSSNVFSFDRIIGSYKKNVIKDLKGYGGIVNITRHKSTLIMWPLTRHVLADVSAEMRQRYGISALADKMMHEESTPTCLKRDEEHVKLLVDQIHQRMIDPFDVLSHPKPLINTIPFQIFNDVFFCCHVAPDSIKGTWFLPNSKVA